MLRCSATRAMTRTLHEPWPKPKRPPSAGDPPSQSAAPQKTAESISRKPYDVPSGVVPHQHPHALAILRQRVGSPGQKVGGNTADRASFDKAQQHPILIGAPEPVASQSLGLRIVLRPRFGFQP